MEKEECSIVNNQQCDTSEDEVCDIVDKEVCEIITETECNTEDVEECSIEEVEECETTISKQCELVDEEKCDVVDENQCIVVPDQVLNYHIYCCFKQNILNCRNASLSMKNFATLSRDLFAELKKMKVVRKCSKRNVKHYLKKFVKLLMMNNAMIERRRSANLFLNLSVEQIML